MSKVSCVRCRSLWIGIGFGLLVVVLLGIAIFDFDFYLDNELILSDIVRYGFALVVISLSGFGAWVLVKMFCDSNDPDPFYLVWGIICAVVAIGFVMAIVNYLPITLDEYYLRSIPENELDTDDIVNLDCHTFEYHYDKWDKRIAINGHGYSGDSIAQKHVECTK